MILRIYNIEELKPVYEEYLKYMSQFFEIKNFAPWYATALNNLQRYSYEHERYIYIIKKSGSILGFALINKHLRFNDDGLSIAEFYIKKQFERQGYGRQLAENVFNQLPGNWEIAVTLKNSAARIFWKKVLSEYVPDKFTQKIKSSFNGYGFLFNNA